MLKEADIPKRFCFQLAAGISLFPSNDVMVSISLYTREALCICKQSHGTMQVSIHIYTTWIYIVTALLSSGVPDSKLRVPSPSEMYLMFTSCAPSLAI